ncbi:hypothetical protein RHGRI_023548 [Rhododendron griersonianum]|uniref:Cytidyltransferase-like domain-containing protein n=1 Tax=Rhododendron griersonianum TaxID=479676 RepID=A0AAV6J5P9_9ERIC|nr:hypothetical protein RHGRI_023548 [Rhododendron griersonianum]
MCYCYTKPTVCGNGSLAVCGNGSLAVRWNARPSRTVTSEFPNHARNQPFREQDIEMGTRVTRSASDLGMDSFNKQVKEVFPTIAPAVGLSVGLAVGQSSIADEISELIRRPKLEAGICYDPGAPLLYLQSSVDILVATPGRLMHHMLILQKGLISAKHRIEMCHLACKSSEFIMVDPWEANQDTFQRTLSVLCRIKSLLVESGRISGDSLMAMLVCGSDLLEYFSIPGFWIPEQEGIPSHHCAIVLESKKIRDVEFERFREWKQQIAIRGVADLSLCSEFLESHWSHNWSFHRTLGSKECVVSASVEFYTSGFDHNDISTFPKSYPIVLTASQFSANVNAKKSAKDYRVQGNREDLDNYGFSPQPLSNNHAGAYSDSKYQGLAVTDIASAALNGIEMGVKTLTVGRANQGTTQPKPEQVNVLLHAQQQIALQGAPVKVRPSDYNPSLAATLGPSQHNPNLSLGAVGLTPGSAGGLEGPDRIFVGGLSYYFTEDLMVTDIACAALNGIKMGDKTLTVKRANQGTPQPKPKQENVLLHAQQQIALQRLMLQPAALATKVLCLTQAVNVGELKVIEDNEDVIEDMRTECGNFGTLEKVVIPRLNPNGEPTPGLGRLVMQKPQGSGVEKFSDVLKSRGGEWTLIPRDEWRVVFEIPISSNPKKDGYTNLAFHEFWWMSSVCGASRSREKSISAISKVAVIGWFIWKARNNIVFNNGVLNPMEAVSKIRSGIPLGKERLKQIVTAANLDDGAAMAAVVFRDHQGKIRQNSRR